MQRGFVSIRGNHDRWLVEREPADMNLSDRFSHQQLEDAHLNWLAGLPAIATYRDEVFLCHGTPHSDTTYWLERVTEDAIIETMPLADIECHAEGISASLILCGHTHIARSVRLGDGRLIVNPGSVGCPAYEGDKPVPSCHAVRDARCLLCNPGENRSRVEHHLPAGAVQPFCHGRPGAAQWPRRLGPWPGNRLVWMNSPASHLAVFGLMLFVR